MKILFISDIHGISKNLDKIRVLINENNFDKIVNLGDSYYCGLSIKGELEVNPNAVKDFLTSIKDKLISLRGNCDSLVDIEKSDFPMYDSILLNVDGLDLHCTHGHIHNVIKSSKLSDNTILIYGHHHIPYIKESDSNTYICIGSVSLPRDEHGPTYAIYENKMLTIYSLIDDKKIMEKRF